LIELMTALSVLAILIAWGLPSFRDWRLRAEMSARSRELLQALALARNEAISGSTRVALCPSSDGELCRQDGQWQDGFLVFPDHNANRRRDAAEPVMHQGTLARHLLIRASLGRKLVIYQRNGGAYGCNVTLRICTRDLRYGARVIVANSGRARTVQDPVCTL
jgi:type IV fimbrial biogenesis protein FimT